MNQTPNAAPNGALAGLVAIVTGGSRGIGAAIVEEFLRQGARVHYVARTATDVQTRFDAIAPGMASFTSVDVSDEKAVDAFVEQVSAASGKVDILVNNAGVTRDGLIMRMKAEDWNAVLNINLTSAFYFSRAVARGMIKQRGGSIINMSSIVGLIGNGGQANYAASKAGLIGLTKSLAREVGSRGVRVNAIAPGYIETEMTAKLNEQQQAALQTQIPMGRIGTAAEIAQVCTFLASGASSYITGEVITVSGGLGM